MDSSYFLNQAPFFQPLKIFEVSPVAMSAVHFGDVSSVRVLGFSVRALAEAAVQRGLSVSAVDHFGDWDLLQIVEEHHRVPSWNVAAANVDVAASSSDIKTQASDVAMAIASFANRGPVLMAGGTENWAPLLDCIFEVAPVFGANAEQMVSLRSLEFWQECCEQVGLCFPEIVQAGEKHLKKRIPPPYSGRQLRKSLASSGGLGVTSDATIFHPNHYLQHEVIGRAIGITYILPPDGQRPVLLGATESFHCQNWPGPSEFIYRGSWGPIRFSEQQQERLNRMAQLVQQRTGLLGWLQMDFIEDDQGQLWLLEMNPRWTAGMEILARTGVDPVGNHLAAWTSRRVRVLNHTDPPKSYAAKAVLYAPHDLQLNEKKVGQLQNLARETFADIPSQPEAPQAILTIPQGHPVLTLRCSHLVGQDDNDVSEPQQRAALLKQLMKLRQQALAILQHES